MNRARERMMRSALAALAALAVAGTTGCGKKAPPFIPVRTTEPVFDAVSALPARGGAVVTWREVPTLPAPPTGAGWWGYRVLRRDEGASPAEVRGVRLAGRGGRRYEVLDLAAPAGKKVTYLVEFLSDDRRVARRSDEAAVDWSSAPLPPGSLTARAGDGRVELSWDPGTDAGVLFQVFRGPTEADIARDRSLNPASLAEPVWIDATVVNGRSYCWAVTRSLPANGGRAESDLSPAVCATPMDATPPAAPAGLAARQGGGRLLLEWGENGEADLAGYRVWLRKGDDERHVERTIDLLRSPRFQDDPPPPGEIWHWSVTAVDTAGNESTRSGEITIP